MLIPKPFTRSPKPCLNLIQYQQRTMLIAKFPRGLHVLLVCPGPIAQGDATDRYKEQSQGLPDSAAKPGGGAKVTLLDPTRLAFEILGACEKRKPELVRPRKARILFTLSQVSPRLGDWLLKKIT